MTFFGNAQNIKQTFIKSFDVLHERDAKIASLELALKEERNRTIEEAIDIVNGTDGIHWLKSKLIIEELKKLKR
jgi:hypothetical protein